MIKHYIGAVFPQGIIVFAYFLRHVCLVLSLLLVNVYMVHNFVVLIIELHAGYRAERRK